MTNQEEALNTLARLMGWQHDCDTYESGSLDDKFRWTDPQGRKCSHGPSPLTNAAHDYAVLVYYKEDGTVNTGGSWWRFAAKLTWDPEEYQVGFYTKAALELIEEFLDLPTDSTL